ncbi:solute carrier family 52, riboflavin transporter, member 3-B-like [Homarus americanus]|nr:solute carrier family 52, riboflavin transporter, member 3-B-like [Homarus americanus]XP_042217180.1 solute carrier family 52, riboflavin transporter, member 3-B-like [Homarus americanus]XP_042217181.1 solute carrier family 52, riboflavin transporter, member 3-B-like [Homarus americanus]XP_042217182.1 solute carrier family 52, riboflavin transporter, member 3-B-like [Homarus americanus]XP_042217183.1 solute carrier family 52, riboflavin transporter, member 3-B-like [Homarus americanus]XP_04
MVGRKPLVDVLAALFGVGAWVAINGLWVELPLLVDALPEGWNLPSYLSVIIQIANVGPIAYSVLSSVRPRQRPAPVVYGVLAVGCIASLLLSLLWQKTSMLGGTKHSTALLALVFLLSLVDCTSSVLFMPYMAVWREIYLASYLVGEGMSGLLPALVALAQGVGGNVECENVTVPNATNDYDTDYILQPVPLHPRFSVTSFFYILLSMMIASALAFTFLEHLPNIKSERTTSPSPTDSVAALEASHSNTRLMENVASSKHDPGMTSRAYWLMLVGQAWACCLTNGVLPSIQSYSCGAYGNTAYHLAVTLSSLANPLAALVTLMLPRIRRWQLLMLGAFGSLVAAYIMATAALSPQPPLVGTQAGEALVVVAWITFTGVMTFVRVEIANQMREEGARALFWCGAVTQAGSAVGAVTTFVLVNVYNLFTPYHPC